MTPDREHLELTVPEPPPQPRRRAGCSVFGWLVLVVLLASIVPGPLADAPRAATTGPDAAQGRTVAVAVTPAPSEAVAGPSGQVGTVLIGGWATYYATCPDCAAAGPLLREALGPKWKGQLVEVQSDYGSQTLRLVTSCACGERKGLPTFIDVSVEAFNDLSPYPAGSDLDPGVIPVWIELDPPRSPADDAMRQEDSGPAATVPPTDIAEETP